MKKISILLLVFVFSFCQSQAQQSIRLNNNWEFVKTDLGGIWEAIRPIPKGNPENLPVWTTVSLPHCYNADDAVNPDGEYYRGPGWYRKQININNPYKQGRTLLHFEGAGQKTDVYVYDTKVGSHAGGYDEFTIDITDAIAAFKTTEAFTKQFKGNIPITIRCDNTRDLETIPSSLSDFNLYGGIYRYLNLEYVPAVSIDKIFALAEVDNAGKVGNLKVNLRLHNPLKLTKAKVDISLIDPAGKIINQFAKQLESLSGDILVAAFTVKNPQLWSPDKPSLYTVKATLSSTDGDFVQEEKIGFRNFEFVEKGPFNLNGKRLLLRGTQRHEDHAVVAAAMTEEMMKEEMILIKEMGANFIRLGHYQQSRIILNLCDSLGLIVWEEIPWCRGGLGGELYQSMAKRMLTNMIEQHYNHPSIIIWGLGNENDWPGDFPEFDNDKIRAFMKELNLLSHQLDITRKTAIRRPEFLKDIVDVFSPSLWAGWYKATYPDYKRISEEEFKKVNHFLHVEWGGDSHAGRHSENPDDVWKNILAKDSAKGSGAVKVSKDGDWSETYICNLFDWHLKEQETMPWLTGTAQWVFKDFSTPLRPDNPVPYVNQKGLVERDFTKKEGYYVFQSYWAEKPMVHIYGHSFPIRWGNEREEKMIKVYSNCDEAELFLNGISLGTKKRNSQDFPAAGLRWNTEFKKGNNTVKVIAKKRNIVVEDQINFQYQTEKWGKPSNLLLEKIKEENGITTLQVKLLDNQNIQCMDAANFIRFSLAGDGQLIDNKGTSSGSKYVQMYNGRATIKVKMKEGKSTVCVVSKGLPTACLNL
ncbi:MAG: glycoside hydrolase family 2 TIM barrel-domain containing protein [Sphingobacteriia bacterium]|jgi:beta-galactosidase